VMLARLRNHQVERDGKHIIGRDPAVRR
jgi:hypothetical protein